MYRCRKHSQQTKFDDTKREIEEALAGAQKKIEEQTGALPGDVKKELTVMALEELLGPEWAKVVLEVAEKTATRERIHSNIMYTTHMLMHRLRVDMLA